MKMKLGLGLYMILVIIAIFVYAPAAAGLGDLSRIIYFHVPLAWVGVLAYLVAMVDSVRYLKTQDLEFDNKANISAEIGLAFTVLATITGAIFARYTWGVYWNWDPRQTSIFFLLMIYGAYFVLRSSVEDEERKARLSAVYCILAFISVPLLVFVIPRLYPTLHPDPIVNTAGKMKMDGKMLQVFLSALVGFTGLYWWIYSLYARLYVIKQRMEVDKRHA
ncbi:MAG: cytochrome c biogenesis protein [Bacillota bacterium]|nr:cytochrome c biogenesis protein [Bacillota bacterium]